MACTYLKSMCHRHKSLPQFSFRLLHSLIHLNTVHLQTTRLLTNRSSAVYSLEACLLLEYKVTSLGLFIIKHKITVAEMPKGGRGSAKEALIIKTHTQSIVGVLFSQMDGVRHSLSH